MYLCKYEFWNPEQHCQLSSIMQCDLDSQSGGTHMPDWYLVEKIILYLVICVCIINKYLCIILGDVPFMTYGFAS